MRANKSEITHENRKKGKCKMLEENKVNKVKIEKRKCDRTEDLAADHWKRFVHLHWIVDNKVSEFRIIFLEKIHLNAFLRKNSFKRIFQKHPCQYEHFEAHFFHHLNVAYLFCAFQSLTRATKKCLFNWNTRRSVAKIFHEFKPVWSLKRHCLYWFQFKVNL